MPKSSVSPSSAPVSGDAEPAEVLEQRVPLESLGQRLDTVAVSLFPDYSRARLQEWIKQGFLQVDGQVAKPKQKVVGGEIVSLQVQLEPQGDWVAEDIPLDLVYSDEHIIVINKPVDMVVHPAAGNPAGTMLNGLLHRFPELEALPRAGIVHRLDKDTTGLLVVARTLQSHASLVSQLQERTMGREYMAVVQGTFVSAGLVDAAIGRHPTQRKKMAVLKHGGKPAVTHYSIEQRFAEHTYLKLKLETGRTHQIRVHMAHIGHPLVGDQTYGRKPKQRGEPSALAQTVAEFPRQALHAWRLSLSHPHSGEIMQWTAAVPDDLQHLLQALQLQAP